MKSKTYRNGKTTFRAYLREVGMGYEVGFTTSGKAIFVGNFIHLGEANQWYTKMNGEIRTFAKRFCVGRNCPKSWYTHFMASHLYKHYYTFVNRVLTQHNRKATQTFTRETRRYQRLNREWAGPEKTPFLKAA